jgi:hypothetical protein
MEARRTEPRTARLALLVAAVASLLGTAPAQAKQPIAWVELCGPSDCRQTRGRELELDRSLLVYPPWVMSSPPSRAPDQAAPWLEVGVALSRRRGREPLVRHSLVAPRIGYAGGDQKGPYGFVWARLERQELRTYKRLARGLERFPASTLPGIPG